MDLRRRDEVRSAQGYTCEFFVRSGSLSLVVRPSAPRRTRRNRSRRPCKSASFRRWFSDVYRDCRNSGVFPPPSLRQEYSGGSAAATPCPLHIPPGSHLFPSPPNSGYRPEIDVAKRCTAMWPPTRSNYAIRVGVCIQDERIRPVHSAVSTDRPVAPAPASPPYPAQAFPLTSPLPRAAISTARIFPCHINVCGRKRDARRQPTPTIPAPTPAPTLNGVRSPPQGRPTLPP